MGRRALYSPSERRRRVPLAPFAILLLVLVIATILVALLVVR